MSPTEQRFDEFGSSSKHGPPAHPRRLPYLCQGRRSVSRPRAGLHRSAAPAAMSGTSTATSSSSTAWATARSGSAMPIPPVVEAAREALADGCNFTRPATIEVACAEQFLGLVAGAEMVKFCKDGSDATSGAVRLARAYTGRDLIACCADHPFFSTDDWFIGTTPMNAGIPEAVQQLTRHLPLQRRRQRARRCSSAIPAGSRRSSWSRRVTDEPRDGFLHELQRLCHANGALFILDEMITGFRWHLAARRRSTASCPDLSCFGKALANGFSVSALAGRREFMRLGGLDHPDRPRVFLLSTTHGAETHALAAAIATMRIYQRRAGDRAPLSAGRPPARTACEAAIERHGLERLRQAGGPAVLPALRDARPGRPAVAGLPHAVPAGDDPPRRADALAGRQLLPRRRRHRRYGRGHRRGARRLCAGAGATA